MRHLGRNLGRQLGRGVNDQTGVEAILASTYQHVVLNSSGDCFTVTSIVLNSVGNTFDIRLPVASAGYVVPLDVLQADGGTSTVTTAILDTDGNTHTVAGTTTMYVFGGVPVTTVGTTYDDIFYTVQDSDGNYFGVTNAVLDSDGNSFDVFGLVGNAWGGKLRMTCGERLVAIDSDGLFHAATLKVKDTDGNLHTVTSAVLDTDGNSFTVN